MVTGNTVSQHQRWEPLVQTQLQAPERWNANQLVPVCKWIARPVTFPVRPEDQIVSNKGLGWSLWDVLECCEWHVWPFELYIWLHLTGTLMSPWHVQETARANPCFAAKLRKREMGILPLFYRLQDVCLKDPQMGMVCRKVQQNWRKQILIINRLYGNNNNNRTFWTQISRTDVPCVVIWTVLHVGLNKN